MQKKQKKNKKKKKKRGSRRSRVRFTEVVVSSLKILGR
jgi:hypothetical protein